MRRPFPGSSVSSRARQAILPAVALVLALAGAVSAEERDPFDVEQHVSSAMLRSQPLSEVPSAVTILTQDDIEAFGFETLAEALSSVRGFFMSSDRNYVYAGMRGFGPMGDWGSRVLIMIDGHPEVGSVFRDSPLGLEFPVPMGAVERIEIVRGPGSAFYGTNAVFGVVNVVTRHDAGGPRAGASFSTDRRGSGSVEFGRQSENPWSWSVHASGFGGRGPDLYFPEYDTPPGSDGWARAVDGERGGAFLATADRENWTVRMAASQRRKEIPTGAYQTVFNDSRNHTTDSWGLLSLDHVHRLGRNSAILGRMTMVGALYRGRYVDEPVESGGAPSVYDDGADGVSTGIDLRGLFQPDPRVRLALGSEVQWNPIARQGGAFVGEPRDVLDKPFWDEAVYGLVEWRIHDAVLASSGMRLEHDSHFGVVGNPRFGAVWQASPRTVVKAMAGRAFRAPNLYELFSDYTEESFNPTLEPEVMWTGEGSVETRVVSGVSVATTVFRNRLDRWIGVSTDPEDSVLYRNHGELDMTGVEFEISGGYRAGLNWNMSYSRSEPRSGTIENGEVPGFARHVGQARIVVPFRPGRSSAAFLFRAVGPRFNYAGTRVPGYGVVDLTAGTDVGQRTRVSMALKNAFDQACADPGGAEHRAASIPGPGRRFELNVKVRL